MTFVDKIRTFARRHPVFTNFLGIIAATILIIWLLGVVFLGWWTHHGDTVTVPSVEGLKVHHAAAVLREEGYDVALDSIYNDDMAPGTVVDQSPRAGSVVKDGRTVYLRYICFTPKLVKVPQYTNTSRRQAEAMFESAGFTNIKVREIPSDYPGLVIAARYNGMMLGPGKEVPAGAAITLEVGAALQPDGIYGDEGEPVEELILPEERDAEFFESLGIEDM